MRQINLKWPKRATCARVVVACLLVSLLVGITGLPMPVSKPTEERFPCEKCPCGCHSAATCWDKCCCHSDEEKLAWAKANGVTPPVFLVQRVAASKHTQLVSASKAPACCSSRKNAASSPNVQAGQGAESSSKAKSCTACAKKSTDSSSCLAKAGRQVKLVLLDPYLDCHGCGKFWKLLQSIYVSPSAGARLEFAAALTEFVALENSFADNLFLPPDGPVPRYC